MKAAVIGIAGTELTGAEANLLRAHLPAGVMLFQRNVNSAAQLAGLTAALHRVLPSEAVVMVDQEGGRVSRLAPPEWRAHPAAAELSAAGTRAAWLTGALIGADCAAAGFDVVTAPVLDLQWPGAHDVIGDRAFGSDPAATARLGAAFAAGLLAAGVQPVMKHLPGHGRAEADSHVALPVVEADDLSADLAPFEANAALPWAMTAHVVYPHWDPENPATLSPYVVQHVVRRRIGFKGVLISDDLAMQALAGPIPERALRALAAGCDLALFCAGDTSANEALLQVCPPATAICAERMAAARRRAAESRTVLDVEALAAERDALLSA